MEILDAFNALGPAFAKRGWVFFGPYRRGQGRSADVGGFVGDAIDAAKRDGGLEKAQAVMVHLLETEQLTDQLAALEWLKAQPFVKLGSIAVGGNSFGGIEVVFGVEHGGYCAGIDSAGGAQSWSIAPALHTAMTRAVRNATAPLFLFQAENDVDLAPTRVLSDAMKNARKPYISKIYPPFGKDSGDGHTFGYFGSAIWLDDALRFLSQYCTRP
jgi:dienelactone hydrolase